MGKKDENPNDAVDILTRISDLQTYIAAIDDQTENILEQTEQLQRDHNNVKEGFNDLLTELTSRFGTELNNNLEEFKFKIDHDEEEGLLIGKRENEGKNLHENIRPVRNLMREKDASESTEVEEFIIEVGIQFSDVVVEFLLFMLERKELEAQYRRFKSLVSDTGSSVEISGKISALIEIVDAEFKKKRAKESNLGKRSPECNDDGAPFAASVKEREINGLIQKILYRILHLESIWRFRCPAEWLIVTREMASNLETRLGEFKRGLDEFDKIFMEMREEFFPYFIDDEEDKVKEFGKKIQDQILGLWKPSEDDPSTSKKRKLFPS